jgi:beta-lactamase class A
VTLILGLVALGASLVINAPLNSGMETDEPAWESGKPALTGGQIQYPSSSSPVDAAYSTLAPELPGINPDAVEGAYRSEQDPSWASVHLSTEEEVNGHYVVFMQESDGLWEARRSVRADEAKTPRNELPALRGVPEDLVANRYAETPNASPGSLPRLDVDQDELPQVESLETNLEVKTSSGDALEASEESDVEELREAADGYEGVAGVWVRDLQSGQGYGVRPDASFYSASVIKLPVMVAVYRKVEQGELSLDEGYETVPEDWAAGAGLLQYQSPSVSYMIEEYLQKMMTDSDNVATNALIRLVGGQDYVNWVARTLGAENTELYLPVSSERGATPMLDNRTTPRDMALILEKIQEGEAASSESCRSMRALLGHNEQETLLRESVPASIQVLNKGGWLYEVYNDAGIVAPEGERYVISVLTKYGPSDYQKGSEVVQEISSKVWKIQDH